MSKTFDIYSVHVRARMYSARMCGHTYRHYKGDEYVVNEVAVDEATGNVVVLYTSKALGYKWVRTLENFTEAVANENGDSVARFWKVC